MTYSPLRYPGGKSKLYPRIREILINNNLNHLSYVEPFAGGYGIGIQLLMRGDITHAILNDYDFHIYAIWHCIFYETDAFIKLIRETPVTVETWIKQHQIYKHIDNYSILEVGFSALFLNRTNYSGVLKGGPIGGLNQTGKYKIDCRFNKNKLIELIQNISAYRNCVELFNLKAEDLIEKEILFRRKSLFINFDPPYVKKGKELYKNYYIEEDHILLSKLIINNLSDSNWILTYDDCPLIRKLYSQLPTEELNLKYSAGKSKQGNEILILHLI